MFHRIIFQFAGTVVLSEHQMRDIAVKSQDLGLSLKPHDVKIISEMVAMMGEDKTPSNMELTAIITRKVAKHNFLQSTHRSISSD